MAASDSYAVTLTAKCGAEISFSRVACVDLNGDFRNVFNMYKPDGIVLGKIQVGSTPNGPWHVVDETEPMSVLSALGYRHIVFQCNKTSVSTVRNAPANAFNVLMQGARRKDVPTKQVKNKKDKLFNDVSSKFKDAGLGFFSSSVAIEGTYIVQV